MTNICGAEAEIQSEKERLIAEAVTCTAIRGIYFLIKDRELIYVGQAVNIYNRVASHKSQGVIDFDSYNWIECNVPDLTAVEVEYILAFRPRLNQRIPRCDRFVTQQILRDKGIGKLNFRKYVVTAKPKQYPLGMDVIYYDLHELKADPTFMALVEAEGAEL
jgi:excinuclease UvrABC nuclease subunit